ncbi:MAG: putative bifunctional diguanylate cyclase/phosphodiesterase [Chloroflexaceae bacterium]
MIFYHRQAVRTFFIIQIVMLRVLYVHSIISYPAERNVWLENSVIVSTLGLAVAYWRGWEPARYVNAGLLLGAVILGVDASYGPTSVAFISVAVPVFILLLADYRWLIGSSIVLMAYFICVFWGDSTFFGPINLMLFITTIIAIMISSLIAESNRRIAETNARHAEAALVELEHLAYTDSLTGCANRNSLYEVGARYLAQLRFAENPLVLLSLDLDRFKRINDTLGHDTGDHLLRWMAVQLRRCIPDSSLLFRLGGDEFVVLLPAAAPDQVLEVARALHRQMQQPCIVAGETLHLEGSIGIATSIPDETSISMLLTRAEIAMYQAKANGAGIQWYHPEQQPLLRERLQLEGELRQALTRDELLLYYQPIFDLPTNQMVMVEALVRWQHPERGLLSPGVFLPIAEEERLLATIDRQVLAAAIQQVATWQLGGQAITVTINLTAQSLHVATLVEDIALLLATNRVQGSQVVIEVTEHTALHDLTTTRHMLDGLRRLGIRIALDDFGTGYASLHYLRMLPVDILKFDKAFAAGIGGQNSHDEAVMQALLTLGRALDLDMVVEGIEQPAQLNWLRGAGNHLLAQGYLLGTPVPPDAIVGHPAMGWH